MQLSGGLRLLDTIQPLLGGVYVLACTTTAIDVEREDEFADRVLYSVAAVAAHEKTFGNEFFGIKFGFVAERWKMKEVKGMAGALVLTNMDLYILD